MSNFYQITCNDFINILNIRICMHKLGYILELVDMPMARNTRSSLLYRESNIDAKLLIDELSEINEYPVIITYCSGEISTNQFRNKIFHVIKVIHEIDIPCKIYCIKLSIDLDEDILEHLCIIISNNYTYHDSFEILDNNVIIFKRSICKFYDLVRFVYCMGINISGIYHCDYLGENSYDYVNMSGIIDDHSNYISIDTMSAKNAAITHMTSKLIAIQHKIYGLRDDDNRDILLDICNDISNLLSKVSGYTE